MYVEEDEQPTALPTPDPPIFFSQYLGSAAQIGLAGSLSLLGAIVGRVIPGFAIPYCLLLAGATGYLLLKAASEYKPENRVIWLLPLGAVLLGASFGVWDAVQAIATVTGQRVAIAACAGSLLIIVGLASLATAKPPTRRKTRQTEASFCQVDEEINPWD